MWERRWLSSPRVAALVIAIGISAAAGVQAQIPAASVRGTVTDATHGVVPLAQVGLRHTHTGARRDTVADSAGRYQVTSLEPGEYELTTRAAGFGEAQRRLTLRVGDDLTVDVELAVEGIRTQVDVRVDAAAVDQTAHGIAGVVTREQIEALPLNGRSFLELARLEPGVSVESVSNPGAFGNNYHRVSVGGSSYLQTRVTVDGSPVEDRINGGTAQNFSQESVQEFQISSFEVRRLDRPHRLRRRQHPDAAGRQRLARGGLLLLPGPQPRRLPGPAAQRAHARPLLRAPAGRPQPGRAGQEGPALLVRQRREPQPGQRGDRRQQPSRLLEARRHPAQPARLPTLQPARRRPARPAARRLPAREPGPQRHHRPAQHGHVHALQLAEGADARVAAPGRADVGAGPAARQRPAPLVRAARQRRGRGDGGRVP